MDLQATLASIDLGFVVSLIGATGAVNAQYIFPGMMLVSLGYNRLGKTMITIGAVVALCGVTITILRQACVSNDSQFCYDLGFGAD